MNDEEREALIAYLAAKPDAGTVIKGTGGARKVRWAIGARGKSGGVRVVTFFSGRDVPLFLLTVFAKGERADLSAAERNELRVVLGSLIDAYKKGVRRHVEGR